MKNTWKIIIVLILASSVIAVVWLKKTENQPEQLQTVTVLLPETKQLQTNDSNNSLVMTIEVVEPKRLPRLVDLGADRCIPCKMMKPVLEELNAEYKDKLRVEFYDVWKYPAVGQRYGIRVIPTQIFLDPNNKELFRHEGYFSKEDILTKWEKLGFDMSKKQ